MKYDHSAFVVFFLFALMLVISGYIGYFCGKIETAKSGLTMEKLVGNTAENLKAIKRECEKDLPRNRECVLVYDYVPVDKE